MNSDSDPQYLMSSTSEEVTKLTLDDEINNLLPMATVSLGIQNNKYTAADFAVYPIRNVLVFRHVAFRAMYEIICAG